MASAQGTEQPLKWNAIWIAHPDAPLREPGVYHFRKSFRLSGRPAHFVVDVSADNGFTLYVNGQRAGQGPARGDLMHWRYETFDLATFLHPGENFIAATVWQFGIYAPMAQFSDRLGFILHGETEAEAMVNTDLGWEVEQEKGHTIHPALPENMWMYYVGGPGETIDAAHYDWDWKEAKPSGGNWSKAGPAIRESRHEHASIPVFGTQGGDSKWWLMPDSLPPMEFSEVPSGRAVRTTIAASASFPSNPAVIPANTTATLLIDAGVVLSAYPELVVNGGVGAHVKLIYTEALYDSDQVRGNRNRVDNLQALGLTDEFLPDGKPRAFMPTWWRTWRYVELQIKTAAEPLTLQDFHTYYTAFPFVDRGSFSSSDPELTKIREISWRTARLDAHETYMDTAYWEQLQYIGDTRIQALISYAVSGDDRLAQQALRAFDSSRTPEGITQSRYPGYLTQLIPPFSLLYVGMLHDYFMYRPDQQLIQDLLPGTRPVLAWFLARQRPDGFLGRLPYWEFVDTPAGKREFPPLDAEGRSALLTLQFIGALQDAAALEEALGEHARAVEYQAKAKLAASAVYRLCWDERRQLLADTPSKDTFSQHANILGVLHDVIPAADQPSVMKRIVGDSSLAQASYFFQFYLTRALDHAGVGDLYLHTLKPWRHMLAEGLTTTPEYPDPSRSDTHAWSAHPAYDLATMVAGIRPASPGFGTVAIQPHLGELEWVEASMPHPAGLIRASFHKEAGGMKAVIELPAGLTGSLLWKEEKRPLNPGKQEFNLP